MCSGATASERTSIIEASIWVKYGPTINSINIVATTITIICTRLLVEIIEAIELWKIIESAQFFSVGRRDSGKMRMKKIRYARDARRGEGSARTAPRAGRRAGKSETIARENEDESGRDRSHLLSAVYASFFRGWVAT
jgi:hypothetical protein